MNSIHLFIPFFLAPIAGLPGAEFEAVATPVASSSIAPSPVVNLVDEKSAFETALKNAEDSLNVNNPGTARVWIERALERDSKSQRAWEIRARWAAAVPDKDEEVYSLHQALRLAIAQKSPAKEIADLRARVVSADPISADLFNLSTVFVAKLKVVAEQYEKEKRPHSAIRVHKEILALDPELTSSQDAIQKLAAAPDPSLAGDAKPKDLLAGISDEWIRAHDAEHAMWGKRDKLERPSYTTSTDAGYAVLVRAGEAMEQMNAFYRAFFRYGTEEDHHSVPKIELNIYRKRADYMKFAPGPPADWSGGEFTGASVETFIGEGGFNDTVQTLFHEAAHQFVSMATGATGWLNEGLASFFEGCRILPNGTVLVNMPAGDRLFPLVARMSKGWMSSVSDGIDLKNASKSEPEKAPPFRIVLEDQYQWGPPWYAPTWGVVYFLYNYQDPVDGRFVYRAAFRKFIDKSSRVGKGAVENFEKVVLADPAPPIKGVVRPKGAADVKLPKNCAELDEVWKEWMIQLAKEQRGEVAVVRPYLQWARYAVKNKDAADAREFFEKGLVATPNDTDLLLEFSAYLGDQKNVDRASKLALEAVQIAESKNPVDEKVVHDAERTLDKLDPKRQTLEATHKELWTAATTLVQRYVDAHLPMMVMDLTWRLSTDLRVPGLLDFYADAVRQTGKSVAHWQLAYNEKDLVGWSIPGRDRAFVADGSQVASHYKGFSDSGFDFQFMTLDTVTSGDFSLEAEVLAEQGKVAFAGLVFGKKDTNNFHMLAMFPGRVRDETDQKKAQLASTGFIDLASSFGSGSFKTWRHVPVAVALEKKKDETKVGTWHKMRIDISGGIVDCWFDGQYVTTQEFPIQDVLRGGFGLISGQGEARFSDVRYVSRPANDMAAQIERQIRIGKLEKVAGSKAKKVDAGANAADGGAKAAASTDDLESVTSVNGSFLGKVPPFPAVKSWVQGTRSNWQEKGPVPQLLVMWSIQQNDLVPIDQWIGGVAQKYAECGLEVVNLVSPNDADAIAAYLNAHKFPGVVAVDRRNKPGIGDTFAAYSILQYNLPRVILLDIDGKVAWEGDPGFKSGEVHDSSSESYLDTPLAELVDKRKLKSIGPWMIAWRDKGAPAVAAGDLVGALELLKQSRNFDAGLIPAIDEAQKKLASLEAALVSLKETSATFTSEETEPALKCLLDYAKIMKKTVDKTTQFALQPMQECKNMKDWATALAQVEKVKARVKPEDKQKLAQDLVTKLGTLSGRFPRELAADLGPVVEQTDTAALQKLLTEAPQRPQHWFVSQSLHW